MKLGISLDPDLSHRQSVPDSESQELLRDGLALRDIGGEES